MNISEKTIIGELVAEDYRTASVFKNHKIDFCCNGQRTIADACESKKLDSKALIDQLEQAVQENNNTDIDFNSWSLDLLADYVEKKHHRYVTDKIQEISPYLHKVVRVHGDRHPELAEIEQLFQQSAGELTAHMKKEELMLFPFIRKIANAAINKEKVPAPMFGSIKNPIAAMNADHDDEGERFRRIAELSQDYTPPADACNTYRVTFSLLQEFEDDLHRHIHLENNILFPKAIELEPSVV